MNASTIINESMTLDEKLAAIDKAMLEAQFDFNKSNGRDAAAPVDPANNPALVCDSCQ